jgi:hypothetical protein
MQGVWRVGGEGLDKIGLSSEVYPPHPQCALSRTTHHLLLPRRVPLDELLEALPAGPDPVRAHPQQRRVARHQHRRVEEREVQDGGEARDGAGVAGNALGEHHGTLAEDGGLGGEEREGG